MMNGCSGLTPAQKYDAAACLLSFAQTLTPILWDGIKTAHASRGITPKEFADGLLICEGTGWDPKRRQCTNDQPLFRKNWFLDATKEPYSQLNLRIFLVYLLYGGRRILFRQGSKPIYARDQDAFFQFFDIPQSYSHKPGHARHLLGAFGQELRTLLRLGTVFTDLTAQTAAALTAQELLEYYNALSAILEPLCRINWHRQQECQQRKQQLMLLFDAKQDSVSIPHITPSEPSAIQAIRTDALNGDNQAQVLLGQYCLKPKEAAQWYNQAALAQNAAGLYHLGRCFETGYGTKRNFRRAAQCYQAAATQEHQPAQYALGRCCLCGIGTDVDEARAVTLFQKLTAQGYAPAMDALGDCYARGLGVPQNFVMATELWLRAFHSGYVPALTSLAMCYYRGIGVRKNRRMAFLWFSRAAREGDARGSCYLGECFRYGHGTTVDYVQAWNSYETAASQGYAPAMYALGQCCADGIGTEEDPIEALNWYCRGAACGHRGARVMAAIALSRISAGNFPAAKLPHRIRQLRKLAGHGDAIVLYELAVCCEQGTGIAPDPRAAFRGYLRAAKRGAKRAMRAVGRCYECGIGVEQNQTLAAQWYQKAIDCGDAVMMLTMAQRCLDGSAGLCSSGIRIAASDAPLIPDPDGAALLLLRAADAGSTDAANRLTGV